MNNIDNMYDVIIVGGGPAGLSSAIYAARAKYKTLVIEKEKFGGQITITNEVVNYPAVYRTSGSKLTEEMKKQASALSGEAKQAKRAQLVQMMRDHNDRSRAFVSKVRDAETVIRNEIMAAVVIASKEYALKNGYTLILDSSQAGVLYSADSMDVTADLLKEVDIVWETAARNKK